MTAQLIARSLSFSRGPIRILDGVDLTIADDQRVGIIGPNGVGKSTLLQILAGELEPDAGRVERHPADAAVSLLAQELVAKQGEIVGGLLRSRTGVAAAEVELAAATDDLAARSGGGDERYAAALERYLRLGADDFDARRDGELARVGLGAVPVEQEVATLSGGQRARLGLAAILLGRADVMLLDEPTNDLDLEGLALLEAFVVGRDGPTVVVSHDRAFLERVVTAVVEIDEHRHDASHFAGGWAAFQHERRVARDIAERRFADYVEQRDGLRARARRERDWATKGVNREKRNPRDNAKMARDFRIERTENLASRARRTERAIDRLESVEKPWEGWDLRLSIAAAPRSGARVAELRGAVVERGSFTLGPIDLTVGFGERVSITGANGHGKSTLLAALLGDLVLAAGTRYLGPSVVVGRLDQARRRFSGPTPLLDQFCDDTGVLATDARSTLAKLGLGPGHVERPTAQLSPGERTRAVLAAFAARGVNLLVLDEPTNHLDLPAIEQVEAATGSFAGTLLLVSHDRVFLEAVPVSRRLVVADGHITADEPAGDLSA